MTKHEGGWLGFYGIRRMKVTFLHSLCITEEFWKATASNEGRCWGTSTEDNKQVRVCHNRQHPGPTQWCLRHNRWHPEEGCTELSRHYLHVPSRTALEGPWCGPGDQQATQGCPHRGTTAPSLPQGPASQHHFCTGWASAKENLNSFQKQF